MHSVGYSGVGPVFEEEYALLPRGLPPSEACSVRYIIEYKQEIMEKWSDAAWKAAEPIYRKIIEHPFVEALAGGTLEREKFVFYLRQDSLYLDNYSRVLARIASRLTMKEHIAAFLGFASEGIAVEKALHEAFLGGDVPSPDEVSPTCLLYTSVLASQATAPVEVEAAAVLPCFWVYRQVGEEILARQRGGNPYRQWIETYADPTFADATDRAVGICDVLADRTGDEVRRRMTDIFVRCTKMEWLFWDSAWRLESWRI